MIVRHFLHWVRTAGAAERADATSALARAYLYSDLSEDDRGAAEGALLMMLDDASPLVRRAMARSLAYSADAPPAVVLALAADQPDIASLVLEYSPLFIDADLVDAVGAGESPVQEAIARRAQVPCAVAAAIAEVGSAQACLTLLENPGADLVLFSLDRIAERFGHDTAVRETLLAREDLPMATRHGLVLKLSAVLTQFVTARHWMGQGRACAIAEDAAEKAVVVIAAAGGAEVRPFVRHLRESGQLTIGIILRALLTGNVLLFEEALAELSGLPLSRVAALVHDRRGAGFRALYDRAGLPDSIFPAFRAAVAALQEVGFAGELTRKAHLNRAMVERVLTACKSETAGGEIAPLMTLLRRFAMEAARAEARHFCEDLMTHDDEDDSRALEAA